MVPETGVGADDNWPQRMTMTTTNVEILRQGWLDAASALAPGLETLPESLENGLDAAVVDERLDEQSLLRVVTDVTSAAADSLPAEEQYFLTRRLQRAVYEYLLSLDALPEPPPRRDGNGHAPADTTLIGAEEVAALGRNGATKTKAEPNHALQTVARPEPQHEPEPKAAPSAGDMEAGLAELDAQLGSDDSFYDAETAGVEAEVATATEAATAEPKPSTRPAFTLFRRTGAKATQPAAESNGHAPVEAEATPAAEPAAESNGHATAAAEETAPNGSGAGVAAVETDSEESFVAPRDGFHLSDLADFAVVQRTLAPATPAEAAVEEPTAVVAEDEPDTQPDVVAQAEAPAQEAPTGAASRGWRLRDDEVDQAQDAASDRSAEDDRFETDPEVVEARLEINDRLRRRRCDEAAALLQRLANDVGGRALAELALDAGDRCRALGKGNAALSCYLAASRADPVHETPLLRLADICIDDHDIDLAVSYLERVTRLRRLRNDDKGALKLYRKIVTIAPYRDDILAMLMRAQANGRFDE
jgi:tetratricopeptide (TPR) repeat protein